MTKDQQTQHVEAFMAKMKKVLISKGDDYAGSEDRLRNFKDAAMMAGVSPVEGALYMIGTKVARIRNLVQSDGVVNNEPLRDSVMDLANYAVLLDEILIESEGALMDKEAIIQYDFLKCPSTGVLLDGCIPQVSAPPGTNEA